MLKIIVRIVLILIVAGVVCGGFYLYANHAGASAGNFGGERPQFNSSTVANSAQAFPARGFDGGHDEGGGSLSGLIGLLGNLSKVGAITAGVVLIQWVVKKASVRKPRMQAA